MATGARAAERAAQKHDREAGPGLGYWRTQLKLNLKETSSGVS